MFTINLKNCKGPDRLDLLQIVSFSRVPRVQNSNQISNVTVGVSVCQLANGMNKQGHCSLHTEDCLN